MTVKVFTDRRCPACGLLFQPVDWLPWRVDGFCSRECWPIKPQDNDGYEQRKSNRKTGRRMLKEAGIEFTVHNYGAHLIIAGSNEPVHFWPGTGRWLTSYSRKRGFGIESLLAELGKKSDAAL